MYNICMCALDRVIHAVISVCGVRACVLCVMCVCAMRVCVCVWWMHALAHAERAREREREMERDKRRCRPTLQRLKGGNGATTGRTRDNEPALRCTRRQCERGGNAACALVCHPRAEGTAKRHRGDYHPANSRRDLHHVAALRK